VSVFATTTKKHAPLSGIHSLNRRAITDFICGCVQGTTSARIRSVITLSEKVGHQHSTHERGLFIAVQNHGRQKGYNSDQHKQQDGR
jgi:hypothetical protein